MLKSLLISIFVTTYTLSLGQAAISLDWVQMSLGGGYTIVSSVAVDSENNIYHCGALQNEGEMDFTQPVIESSEYFSYISKLTPSGAYIWGKAFFGSNLGQIDIKKIKITKSGEIICVGSFFGTVDFDPSSANFDMTSPNGTSTFALKLSSSGEFIWARALQALVVMNSGNYMFGFDLDAQDNIFISGSFTGKIDLDPGFGTDIYSTNFTYEKNAFLVKLDKNGNYSWANVLVNGSQTDFYALAINKDNEVIVSGHFYNTLSLNSIYLDTTFVPPLWPTDNQMIIKYDNNGEAKWVKHFIGGNCGIGEIICNSNNEIFILGNFANGIYFSPYTIDNHMSTYAGSFSGASDGFIAKYSNAGSFEWANKYGGIWSDGYPTAALNETGNIVIGSIISGVFGDSIYFGSSFLGDSLYNRIILEVNSSGELVKVVKLEGGGQRFNDFVIDSKNNLIAVGTCHNQSYEPIDFDPSPNASFILPKFGSGAFVLKYRFTPKPGDAVLIFPNPSSSSVTIDLGSLSAPAKAQIFDFSGKLVFETELSEIVTCHDISGLAGGMHVFRIVSNDQIVQQKFLKY